MTVRGDLAKLAREATQKGWQPKRTGKGHVKYIPPIPGCLPFVMTNSQQPSTAAIKTAEKRLREFDRRKAEMEARQEVNGVQAPVRPVTEARVAVVQPAAEGPALLYVSFGQKLPGRRQSFALVLSDAALAHIGAAHPESRVRVEAERADSNLLLTLSTAGNPQRFGWIKPIPCSDRKGFCRLQCSMGDPADLVQPGRVFEAARLAAPDGALAFRVPVKWIEAPAPAPAPSANPTPAAAPPSIATDDQALSDLVAALEMVNDAVQAMGRPVRIWQADDGRVRGEIEVVTRQVL